MLVPDQRDTFFHEFARIRALARFSPPHQDRKSFWCASSKGFPVRVIEADRRAVLSPYGRMGGGEGMTSKGRKVISEVISEYERENGKRRLGCVCRVPVIDGSRVAI